MFAGSYTVSINGTVVGGSLAGSMKSCVIAIATISEANRRGAWQKHHKRTSEQRAVVAMVLRSALGRPPVDVRGVRLTRIHPARRRLDSDNAISALKHCRDGVQDYLGINDSKIRFEYGEQELGPWGVRVEVFS